MRSGRPRACSWRPGAEQRRACPPSPASSVPPRSPESCLLSPAPGLCSLCSACPAGHCWHLGTHPGAGAVHPPYYLRGQASPLHTVTPDVKAGAQTGQGCCLELSPEPQAGQPQAGARPARHLGPGLRVQERSHTAGPVLPGASVSPQPRVLAGRWPRPAIPDPAGLGHQSGFTEEEAVGWPKHAAGQPGRGEPGAGQMSSVPSACSPCRGGLGPKVELRTDLTGTSDTRPLGAPADG